MSRYLLGGRVLSPCGTEAAYRRHRRRGETTDQACREAHARYQWDHRHRPGVPRQLIPCGTAAAYRRHLRRGELACRPCLDAHAAAVAAHYRPRGVA